ncbi:protein trichome birefringence-like 19 [Olea europaea var. sylvestris]|uniref:protein trichome birefringence-like 19 n=1 Tax=Olea europaea var. sylvestris TaxID=158386 RepID=UPI000C1D5D5F|nr:protein trichome birefringence-like 19 [Olea europaea var. sylvestris]
MKSKEELLPSGKDILFKSLFFPILGLVLITALYFYLPHNLSSLMSDLDMRSNDSVSLNMNSTTATALHPSSNDSSSVTSEQKCNIFQGDWIPFPEGPYYTNETKCVIDDRQNCMKFGRPDSDFMKWRWKPSECELPLFDAKRFLELVRGKTLAFVGDSLARNQMQSLVCLLASAANPVDVSTTTDTRFRRWLYTEYNFTLAAFWSPHLVRTQDYGPEGYNASHLKLYLDEADEAWAKQTENVDIFTISASQWFFRPFIGYEKGQIVGCHMCSERNIRNFSTSYGYKMAFRTAFRTFLSLENYNNKLVFLRTFSPAHFENGDWDKGGSCERTKPFKKQEMKLEKYVLDLYMTQVEEFKEVQKEGEKKGLRFRLLDTTRAMVLRPDGHPNHYGHWPQENKTLADCVHWCLPGPVDTWNEFLLHILHTEEPNLAGKKLKKNE